MDAEVIEDYVDAEVTEDVGNLDALRKKEAEYFYAEVTKDALEVPYGAI